MLNICDFTKTYAVIRIVNLLINVYSKKEIIDLEIAFYFGIESQKNVKIMGICKSGPQQSPSPGEGGQHFLPRFPPPLVQFPKFFLKIPLKHSPLFFFLARGGGGGRSPSIAALL